MPRSDRLLRLLVGPLSFAVVATGIRPELAGVYGDDAIYLSTAAAIADGVGPVVAELPGAPFIVKYPPLYAWSLAGLDTLGVDLHAAWGVGMVMALSAVAWAVAVDRLVNRLMPVHGGTPIERGLVAIGCALNTVVIGTVPTVMTEGVYTLVLVAQLGATGVRAGLLALVAGGLRSAGLVVNLALAVPRRRAAAVLVGTGAAVALTAWARAGWEVPPGFLYYYADYGTHTGWYAEAWAGGGAAALGARLADVVAANLHVGASSLGELVFPLRTGGAAGDPWPYGVGMFALAVVGLGRRAPALLPPVLLNTALFLAWTWPFAPRFWLPVYPLLVAGAVWGLGAVPRVGRAVMVPVVLLFTVGNAIVPVSRALAVLGPAAPTAGEEARLEALERWLDAQLGPGDCFVGGPESLWLARRHGFQAVPLKTLLPRDVLLATALGIPAPLGDTAGGLAALRDALPGSVILVVLPAGAGLPAGDLVVVPDPPEGYAVWRVEG